MAYKTDKLCYPGGTKESIAKEILPKKQPPLDKSPNSAISGMCKSIYGLHQLTSSNFKLLYI